MFRYVPPRTRVRNFVTTRNEISRYKELNIGVALTRARFILDATASRRRRWFVNYLFALADHLAISGMKEKKSDRVDVT